ncbi:DUF7289 family protein [Natrarchaeobaculum aegyptiacum]|uniref:Uncharacterized protein n=1 Tax=Natrarchaeobaculum aegyptiacum TaxID=745377 RepID=A0A2Z2HPD1_9EURY|nr:hypothetical protein [Natrarchaeobaculum aegyptiacum]ARS88870.1 hypothetical protein B1756_03275 [Natrarchaeobaculum aegyptiacum]
MKSQAFTPGADSRDGDRGVSEVLAFVMVFGIILASVGLLSMTAFQAMEEYQEFEQVNNAERAMSALAENFDDVVRYDGVEHRYGEIAMQSGSVVTSPNGTTLNITANDRPLEDEHPEFENVTDDGKLTLGTFRYEHGSEEIAYESGGVIRATEFDGEVDSVVREYPPIRYNEETDTAVISLVAIDADERSLRSDGSIGVSMHVEDRTTKVLEGDDLEIRAEDPDTRYGDAWDDVLEGWDGEHEPDRVVLTIVEVEVDY